MANDLPERVAPTLERVEVSEPAWDMTLIVPRFTVSAPAIFDLAADPLAAD